LNLDKILEKLKHHKVVLHYLDHNSEVHEAVGILVDFDKDVIHLEMFNNYGESSEYYLNRYACTLLSIIDEGEEA